jgi:hypothetical protein
LKAYLIKLCQLKADIDDILLPDDPELERKFHEGNTAYKDPRFEYIIHIWMATERNWKMQV